MSDRLDPAPRDSVIHWWGRLSAHMPPVSRDRVSRLIDLIGPDGRICYADAYRALFPDSAVDPSAKTRADKAFQKFRDTLSSIAEEHGIHFELRVDQRRKADPAERHIWFVTPDDSEQRVADFSEKAIAALGAAPLAEQYVAVQAETPELVALAIYAEPDRAQARDLLKGLETQLRSIQPEWCVRDYRDVPAGEHIPETQRCWLEGARLVLFLLSPDLVLELKTRPLQIPADCRLVPLGFIPVDDELLEGTTLAGRQVFVDDRGNTWPERDRQQREWLRQAARLIVGRKVRAGGAADVFEHIVAARRWPRDDVDPDHFVDPLATTRAAAEGQPALPLLLDWLRDPAADVFCAVFGELGMGKTTLCQQLTAQLLERRQAGEPWPLPLYLDLRAVNTMLWNWEQGVPELEAMLAHLIATNYNIPEGQPRPDVGQVKRLAQQQGGLVIFDGLDEVMNRLTPQQCRQFVQNLWSILPPALWKRPRGAAADWQRPAAVGRLVMSCRSHFFQTLRDQLNFFDGEQRESVRADDYLWLTLLPFSADQVESYYRQVFAQDPARAEQVIRLLDQVHDLRQLGSRPYNLRLIQDQIDELESKQRAGEAVDIADLYEGMVGQWLRRDEPKHRLGREHKLLLMERLAHRLWSSQQRDLPHQDLEDWLRDQLLADPRWERIEYRAYLEREGGPAVLQEDLRNASFMVREGDDRFRFAHTSIMEFFLARALHRALVAGAGEPAALDQWAVPTPSPETLDFLGGLISRRDTDVCLAGLSALRARYRPRASELALAYALRAAGQGYAGDTCSGFQLQGAALAFQRWQGRPGRPLDWRGSDFSGAELRGGHFEDCDFSACVFDDADLTGAVLDRCRLDRISAVQPNLTGAVVHDCSVDGAVLSQPRLYHTQWLGRLPSGLSGYSVPGLFTANQEAVVRDIRPIAIAGHSAGVRVSLAAPDGRWLATGGYDGRVVLWDPSSGRELHRLEGLGGVVRAMVVAPSGAWLAAGAGDGRVVLWDPSSGRELHRLEGHDGWVSALAVAPDGAWLATGAGDGQVVLWDPSSGRELHRLEGHGGWVNALAVAPDGAWLAVGADDGWVVLWDPSSGRELHRLEGHGGQVNVLAVAPDGVWLAVGADDGLVALWDPSSGRELRRLEGHEDCVSVLVVAPNGNWLAAGADDSRVLLWNPSSGRELYRLEGYCGGDSALAVAPNGDWLAAGADDGWVLLWDPSSGRELRRLEGHDGWVSVLAVAPNGDWLASGKANGRVVLWDPSSGRELHRLAGHGGWVNALAVAPDGDWLAAGAGDGPVVLWDPSSGRELHRLEGHDGWISALAVAPDGAWLATGAGDGPVVLWDPSSGRELHRLEGHDGWVNALAVAPDGAWLATGAGDGSVVLWDPSSGRELPRLEGHGVWVGALAVAPDVTWLAACAGGSRVVLWDPSSGRELHCLEGHGGQVNALAVAPDGVWLAVGADDGSVVLWDPSSGRELHRLEGRRGLVGALAVAPGGAWLAAGTGNGRVVLWDPSSGRELHRLQGHGGWFNALAVAPNGSWLASAGMDGLIRRWTLPPDGGCPFCDLVIERLPEGNWVVWRDPDGPDRRWVHWSPGAWRWLGWHAPLPDGKRWMNYPMDAFVAPGPSDS